MGQPTKQPPAETERNRVKVVPLLAVLLSGAFVAILNETLLNVAITPIMESFQVEASTAQWLATVYLLVIAVLVPVSAFLIQRFTTRQLYTAAMLLFGAGTLIAGTAPAFALLLLGRILQAAGTGILIPLFTNVILAVIPPERRGRVMGLFGLVIMFAPAVGPTVSGLIVDYLSWRWLFYLVLPIAVIAILYGIVSLKNVTEVTRPKMDLISVALSTIGFGGVVFGFSSAGEGTGRLDGSGSGHRTYGRTDFPRPVCDPPEETGHAHARHAVFAYPMFTLAILVMMIVVMTMFATMIVLPIYLLKVLAFSAVTVGLIMLPGGLINGALSPVMGYLFDRFGPRWLLIPGVVTMTVTVFLFRSLDPGTSPLTIVILHTMLMVSVAMVMMPAQTNGLNQLPPYLYPHGAAIANTLMQVSGAIGTALFVTIMTLGQQRYMEGHPGAADETAALAAGVKQAFTFGFLLAVLALSSPCS